MKKWPDVEQSQEYNSLTPQSKFQAKKEYWDSVISTKNDYITLPEISKQKAKKEFFGGELVEDLPESQFSKKNVAIDTIAGTGMTLGKSAVGIPVNMAKGAWSLARHPIQSAKVIGGTAVGFAQKAIPGEQKQERYADALIQNVQNRYGGREVYDEKTGQNVPAYAKTISSDPFGFLLDVYTLAGASGAVMKGVGKATKTQALEKAGSFPMTAQASKQVGTAIKSSAPYRSAFPGKAQKLEQTIDIGIRKGIRPSVVGKRTSSQTARYRNNAQEAVKTIIENKNNLRFVDELGDTVNRLPQNLDEFSQAISQTKSQIYKYYDDLIDRSGQQKGVVDLSNASKKLDAIIDSKALRVQAPEAIAHAQKVQERLASVGKITVREADDLIEGYNNSLQAFYKNPSYDMASKASIDSMIANTLRSSLDDVVSGITGKQFQAIKNKYGALKAIERDVNRRAIVAGRQNVKGLLDFTDIFSAGDVISGITGFNPARIAKGIAQMKIKNIYQKINDPNNIVKRMFDRADRLHEPLAEAITPEILSNLPVNMQKAITMSQRPKQLTSQTKLLSPPRDFKYNPTGQRNVGPKPIVTPSQVGGDTILGQAPYGGTTLPVPVQTPRVKPTFEQMKKTMQLKTRKGNILRSPGNEKVFPKDIVEINQKNIPVGKRAMQNLRKRRAKATKGKK
jgi:hypothetical protein